MHTRSETRRALKDADPNQFDRMIGQRIRRRRNELGLTQTQLGSALGVSFQQVQKYERGLNRVPASRLRDLTRALDIGVSYFLDLPDQPDIAAGTSELMAVFREQDSMRLVRAFERIPDASLRKAILHLIEMVR